MIAIARTLSTASRHGRTNYQVCQRSVTSVVAFNVSNNRSRAVCRKNHSHDIIGMYHNIDDIRLRPKDRSYIRRFASHAAQQQQKEEDDEYSVDEIDKEEEDLMAEVHEANERHAGNIQVKRTNDNQYGVFTCRPYPKGSIVISSNLINTNKTSCSHSIQVDWNTHILMTLPARYLNHSCGPNIGVRSVNKNGSYDFVALRDIDAGEEVRFDYETTEYEIGAFTKCLCGSSECRDTIGGYKYNSDVVHAKYDRKYIANYLLDDNADNDDDAGFAR